MRTIAGKVATLGLCLIAGAGCIPKSTVTRPSVDRSLLTEEQFADKGFNNVYDVVAAFRANWLNARGPDSFAAPTRVQAYVDGSHLGTIETLRAVEVRPVVYIRYFDGFAATARWGIGHGGGVVYVSTHPMDSASNPSTPE